MDDRENLKIVIVGHVDHGKSTLIGRILYDNDSLPPEKVEEIIRVSEEEEKDVDFSLVMDQLEEERTQGITIDTAQIFFKTDKRDYVIIDAPGHKQFMKNMITGASQADVAILIVDVSEKIKEQTKRHAYIIDMLGLKNTIVLVNKMDGVKYQAEKYFELKEMLVKFFSEMKLNPSHIIPISAKEGDNVVFPSENMSWYDGATVIQALDSMELGKKESSHSLLFPLQDVFPIQNKRVFFGRVESGCVKVGMDILLFPSMVKTKIESIERLWNSSSLAVPGECIGVTLEGNISADRGEVLCEPASAPKFMEKFSANIYWMHREPLKLGDQLILKCSTQTTECIVKKIIRKIDTEGLESVDYSLDEKSESEDLKDTEMGVVEIELLSPIVIEEFNALPQFGRVVLGKDEKIYAVGIIMALAKDEISTVMR